MNYSHLENYIWENFSLILEGETKNLNRCFENFPIDTLLEYKFGEKEPLFFEWKGIRFPVFIHNNEKELFNDAGLITFDVYQNIFFFISGLQERQALNKDKHERFRYIDSIQYKYQITTLPVVNIYIELLLEVAAKHEMVIRKKKFNGKESCILFTHDIDQLRSGWYEDIGYSLKNKSLKNVFDICKSFITKFLYLKDSYLKGYEKMIEIERENQIESIIFFMAKKSNLDGDYDISKAKFNRLIKEDKYNEIHLHPGYHTYNDKVEFNRQKKIIEQYTGKPVTKIRQHFLKYNVSITPKIHQESGIEEDFSLGFAEHYGFRNGIAYPFYLFDFENYKAFDVVEYPTYFMDGTITHYMKGDRNVLIQEVLNNLDFLSNHFNFCFSVLFHNTAFTEKKYKGLTKMYEDLIRFDTEND